MKKYFLAILFVLCASNVCAEKIYMGVFGTSSEYGAWITLRDAPCNSIDGNALIMSGRTQNKGCWKIEEKQVKIEWFGITTPNFYEMDGFKLVGDSDFDNKKQNQPIQNTKVNLYCQAQAWTGDVVLERDVNGSLRKMSVGGEDVSFNEKESSISFTYNNLNLILSTTTGLFSYESTAATKLLFGANRRGTGKCEIVDGNKRF